MAIAASPSGGVLFDTNGRDTLRGNIGNDIFTMHRDGLRDYIRRFDLANDQIDLSAFNVTWQEVNIAHRSGNNFIITIRGERTMLTLEPDPNGQSYDFLSIDETSFIFNTGAATPASNILLDQSGKSRINGTDQPDIFIFHEDYETDVIKFFDPQKDKVDLSGFNVVFSELEFETDKAGKVMIHFAEETIIIRDCSYEMIASDYTEDMFIF